MLSLADRHADLGEVVDTFEGGSHFGRRAPAGVHRNCQPCVLAEASHSIVVALVGIVGEHVPQVGDDLWEVALEQLQMRHQGLPSCSAAYCRTRASIGISLSPNAAMLVLCAQ